MSRKLEGLLSNDEAARMMGIKPRALHRLRAAGRGPIHTYVGRFPRYRREHVAQYLAARAVVPRAE